MVTKQLSIAIAIGIFIGSGIAFKTFAAAPPSATRIEFDQVFADATRQSQSQYVNRAHKSNRLKVKFGFAGATRTAGALKRGLRRSQAMRQ